MTKAEFIQALADIDTAVAGIEGDTGIIAGLTPKLAAEVDKFLGGEIDQDVADMVTRVRDRATAARAGLAATIQPLATVATRGEG